VYKRVLLQTSAVDTGFLLICFLVQPVWPHSTLLKYTNMAVWLQVILIVNGRGIMYGVGPVMRVETHDFAWNYWWVAGWLASLAFVHYAIPWPFFYRYMLLCR
jgi:hypothetical protein